MPVHVPSESIRAGLAILLEAFEFAQETASDTWDFAVERAILLDAGHSTNQLRRLLAAGLAEHALELRHPDNARRPIRRSNSFRFRDNSCFILTTEGVKYARQVCAEATSKEIGGRRIDQLTDGDGKLGTHPAKPHWDGKTRRLTYEGAACIELTRAADNPELVLNRFEDAGWPPQIPDPIPPDRLGSRKRRHHNTISWLNRRQQPVRVHFASAEGGEAIRWSLAPPVFPKAQPTRRLPRRRSST